jgi:hypothetical protein
MKALLRKIASFVGRLFAAPTIPHTLPAPARKRGSKGATNPKRKRGGKWSKAKHAPGRKQRKAI